MGRKRKWRGTDPGRAKKNTHDAARYPNDRAKTIQQPHRHVLPEDARGRAEAESPIGRLLLSGRLKSSSDHSGHEPNDRYDAATRFAYIVSAYRSVIGTPRNTSTGGKGYPCEAAACAGDYERCECLRRKIRYDNAFEALSRVGNRACRVVSRVAVHREPIGVDDLIYLIAGLDALALHFGYTNRRARRRDLIDSEEVR